jgi:hypothetical protein
MVGLCLLSRSENVCNDALLEEPCQIPAWILPKVGGGKIRLSPCVVPRREKSGRLEARRVPVIESLGDAVDEVHYIVILLLHSWSTPHITAGQL